MKGPFAPIRRRALPVPPPGPTPPAPVVVLTAGLVPNWQPVLPKPRLEEIAR